MYEKISRRQLLRSSAATGVGLLMGGSGFPALGQEKEELELPVGASGTLTVIHRTEYFEQAQTLFRQTVEQFAAANNTKLDISTTNPESFGDFLGKMTAAVKAGNPPDFAYTTNVSIPQMHLLDLVEDVTDVVDEAVSRYGNIMPGINAPHNGRFDGRWKAVPFLGSSTAFPFRGDKLAEKGIDPATLLNLDQRREAAIAISDANSEFWGWGLTPNQSGDGYGFVIQVIQAFGGHYTDETDRSSSSTHRKPWRPTSGSRRPTTAAASTVPCCRQASSRGPISPTTRRGSPARSATRSTPTASTRHRGATAFPSSRTSGCSGRRRPTTATAATADLSAAG
jgi:multiple sugar transport system substrate-binding protein